MFKKIIIERITYFITIMFFLTFMSHEQIAQTTDTGSIPPSKSRANLIIGIVYKPFNYELSIFDSDPGNYFYEPHMYTYDDLDLKKTNMLNNYSIGVSISIPINSKLYIKTGLEFSQILYYYGGIPSTLELKRYEETFGQLLYSYVNTLGFKHIQIPLVWSYQPILYKNRVGYSINLGFLFSHTIEHKSYSKLYWYEYVQDGQETRLEKTGILAYDIILDSETSTFKNTRYNKKGEAEREWTNLGSRAARKYNVGGLGELSVYYNITSSLRLSAGVWINIDFYPIEQRGRAGDLTPLIGDVNLAGRNIDYFYNIRKGFSMSFKYLLD